VTFRARLERTVAGNGKLLAVMYCLTACEGQLVEYPLDAGEPPQIISTHPLHGAMAVAPGSPVSATFSRAMQPSSLNVTTFTLMQDSTRVLGVVTLDDASDTATFDPERALQAARRYTATVTREATDLQGRSLPADYTWSFSVAQVGVVELSTAAGRVEAPDYMLDASTIVLLADADDVVQSATGSAVLHVGRVTGQSYVVVAAADLDSYAALDEAFASANKTALTLSIPVAAFTLLQVDLTTPQVRTLIVANISEGVPSYQAFEVTFHAFR
jgi:hypothetical protein